MARDTYNKDVWAGILATVWASLTMPFLGVIARETLKASAFEISVLTMAPLAGASLSLVWSRAMEGRRKMPFAVLGWVVSRVLFLFMVFATTSPIFVGMVTFSWLLSSVSGPAYSALMKEVYPDSDRARIMGYARVCLMPVSIVVAAVAGPLLGAVSYRYVFPVAGLFGIASALVFNGIRAHETEGDSETPLGRYVRDSVLILRENRPFRHFCTGILFFGGGLLMASPIFIIYQVDVLEVNTRWAALYTVVSQITAMAAYVYWGSHIDRRSPSGAVLINTLLWCVIPLMYVVSSRAWMLLPAMALAGVSNAGIELAYLTSVLHYAPKSQIAQYQAVLASLTGLRGIFAPFIGVALVQSHWLSMKQLFVLATVIMLIGAGFQLIGMRVPSAGKGASKQPGTI